MGKARLREVLVALRDHYGSMSRLANRVEYSSRAVREWFKKSEAELQALPNRTKEALVGHAVKVGLPVEIYAEVQPLWDPQLSFEENAERPPALPPRSADQPTVLGTSVLGHAVRSPFGASASVLTADSARIQFLAAAGNSVLTFKTIRTSRYASHPWPNIYSCEPAAPELSPGEEPPTFLVGTERSGHSPTFGLLNRFGMPSPPPEVWQSDFRHALTTLDSDQLLLLSVVGTAGPKNSAEMLVKDFASVVTLAIDAGASVIELNLSCPNCVGREGVVYADTGLAKRICKAARTRVTSHKLVAKIGYLPDERLQELVLATAPYLDGYTAINTVPVEGFVRGIELEPAFKHPGLKAGLSGKPILRLGLHAVGQLAEIREHEHLTQLSIIGVGGVSSVSDVQSYLDAGADAVQATTVFFTDPLFGRRVERYLATQPRRLRLPGAQERHQAKSNWLAATEELEEASPDKIRLLEGPATEVWMQWSARERAEAQSGGPRRPTAPSVDDFKSRIISSTPTYLRRS